MSSRTEWRTSRPTAGLWHTAKSSALREQFDISTLDEVMNRKADIVIAGYYGYGNLGDEAIRVALRDALDKRGIDAMWLTARPQAQDEIDRRSVLRVYRALRHSRALVFGGGGLLQNRTSNRSLLYYLGLMGLSRIARKSVLLLGQGIGPIHGRFARLLTRIALKHAAYIGCRDQGSAEFLRNEGLNAVLDGDLFFLLPPVEEPPTRSSAARNIVLCLKGTKNEGLLCHSRWVTQDKGSSFKMLPETKNCLTTKDTKGTKGSEDEPLDPAPKVGHIAQPIRAFDSSSSSILRVLRVFRALRGEFPLVSVPRKPKSEITAHSKRQGTDKAEMVEKTVHMLDEVSRRTKISVTLLPFFPAQDLDLSEKIAERASVPCQIMRADTIDNTMHVLEKADLVISSRLHGLEFALRAGVPMIAINEDQKINAFVAEVKESSGLEIPCIGFPSCEQVLRVLGSPPSPASVRGAYVVMHTRATEVFSRFVAVLEEL